MPVQEVDPIWDALTEEFGPVRTKSERGRRNAAVRELREADATAEEIKIAANFCRRHFTTFTEMALCNWLSRSIEEHKKHGLSRETFLRLVEKKK